MDVMAEVRGEDAERLLAAANEDCRAGRLDVAVAKYRRYLEANPGSAAAHIALGLALHSMASPNEAIACLQRAAELAPRSYEAAYSLGVVLAEQRRPDDAIAAYRAALAINPDAAAALINVGVLLQARQRLDEAIACFERAVRVAPNAAAAHAALGNALFEGGQRDAALTALRRAVDVEPGDARWHVNLGRKLDAAGEHVAAAAALRRALQIRPGDVGALALLPIVLQRLGAWDEARALLDYPQLLGAFRLERAEGWSSPNELNSALAAFVRRHPTLQRDPPGKATQVGSQTLEIFRDAAAPMESLRRFIAAAIREYMARIFPAARAHFPERPAHWDVQGWAVVLRSGGYQTAHYHPYGLISGVYYVEVPEVVLTGVSDAGCIRFGEAPNDEPNAAPEALITATVKPEPGLLLLFPSSFWHRTMPFESDQDRICIAFDVIAGR